MSDSHKIAVQLCLDVAAFAHELRGVGVEPGALEAYGRLQEQVTPDPKPDPKPASA